MSALDDRCDGKYEYLEKLSTDELYNLLRRDFETRGPDVPVNADYIDKIMEVIIQREESDAEAIPFRGTEEALAEFDEYYRPTMEELPAWSKTGRIDKLTWPPRSKRTGRRALRVLVAVAIVCATLLGAAGAFQIDLFKMAANWSQSFFQFHSGEASPTSIVNQPQTALPQQYTSLSQALEFNGMTVQVEPLYFPEEYSFVEADVYAGQEPMASALYENGDSTSQIVITVVKHAIPQPDGQEKDSGPVAIVNAGGIEHYLMENNGQTRATWFNGNYECTIRGDVSREEMEKMIQSIY